MLCIYVHDMSSFSLAFIICVIFSRFFSIIDSI